MPGRPQELTETFSTDLPETLERDIYHLLERVCDAGLKLATAESCTGGLLASLLTDVDGFGHALDRGFVVYTDAAKTEMLGVEPTLLEAHGAVSAPVARAMAEGALARSEADIAVAITGFAGPTGGAGEEGLVHFACARAGWPVLQSEMHYGSIGRGAIRLESLKTAISLFEQMLEARSTERE
ncbi:MAG TPA: CinA family protein [Paracoccaceae bacterium]|nr:CinA family protein [Paracoccaceae bacterium]